MTSSETKRLSKVAKEFNVATTTIVQFLKDEGIDINAKPTTKIGGDVYEKLLEKFQPDKIEKERSDGVVLPDFKKDKEKKESEEVLIKSNVVDQKEAEKVKAEKEDKVEDKPEETDKTEDKPKSGLKVLGKIDLKEKEKDGRKKKKTETEKEEKAEEKVEPKKEELKEETDKEKEKEFTATESKKEEVEEKAKKEEETKEDKPEEKKEEKAVEQEDKEEKKVVEKPETTKIPEDEEDKKGLTILGKIDLKSFEKKKKKPVASTSDLSSIKKKRRRRRTIGEDEKGPAKDSPSTDRKKTRPKGKKEHKPAIDDKQIEEQIKETLSKLSGKSSSTKGKAKVIKRKKRELLKQKEQESAEEQSKIIQVNEFITVNDLASMMDVPVTEVITACMNLGLMVSINQRLDAETIQIVADEFGYETEFKDMDLDEPSLEEPDNPENMIERAPIVTIMGHVDHGKTSLLDYIRKSNIIAGESGGITQHIGAYEVMQENGKSISFLDTPGHEAFTAMRARGAKVTDIAIIVIAADDSVMPQTKEAISHAQAAGVPIVFAFNKIDKETANPDKVREQLSEMNILVEEWGGKYQTQEISAKSGLNIDELLEKVLLESELLELKADPKKRATGTVIEATLDRGKGIVTTVLVQSGTLRVGDPVLAGANFGRVKALFNERGKIVEEAGPSSPVQLLGMDGAPQAGDKFYVTETEAVGKELSTRRKQLIREQGIRTKKHITLDEIGRRLAIGTFKELNVIIKGDVDGSIEALSDSMQKLSTDEIQVNVIHKGVGQISESDVLLASASDAIIVGFQVRPSLQARKLAEQEQIDIRLYSVIYDAIDELKMAMEGMLSPGIEEKITGNAEVRDVFKVTKVGTVAGCMMLDGKIKRNSKVRLVRNGVVVYSSEIMNLKRFKEDVKEVVSGYECGISLKNFNDFKVGDIIEAYEEVEVKRTL